jgi:Glycosyltransferase WbsX
MDRRTFLTSSVQAGLAAGLVCKTEAQSTDRKAISTVSTRQDLPTALIGEAAMTGYFNEQRLHEAMGTTQLQKPTDVKVVVFNFPSWHPSRFMEERFGKGWTEFDTLRNARTLFPGHTMPHYPLWGYYDESDPVWAAKEVDLAVAYGIDAWMIDWYWHSGTQFYQEQLEQGFLRHFR